MCSTHARWGAVLQHAALVPAPGCFRALGPAGSSGMGRAGSRPACLGAVLLLWSCESSQAAAQCVLRSNARQERATETDLYFSSLRRRKKVSLDESAASNSREGNFFLSFPHSTLCWTRACYVFLFKRLCSMSSRVYHSACRSDFWLPLLTHM